MPGRVGERVEEARRGAGRRAGARLSASSGLRTFSECVRRPRVADRRACGGVRGVGEGRRDRRRRPRRRPRSPRPRASPPSRARERPCARRAPFHALRQSASGRTLFTAGGERVRDFPDLRSVDWPRQRDPLHLPTTGSGSSSSSSFSRWPGCRSSPARPRSSRRPRSPRRGTGASSWTIVAAVGAAVAARSSATSLGRAYGKRILAAWPWFERVTREGRRAVGGVLRPARVEGRVPRPLLPDRPGDARLDGRPRRGCRGASFLAWNVAGAVAWALLHRARRRTTSAQRSIDASSATRHLGSGSSRLIVLALVGGPSPAAQAERT